MSDNPELDMIEAYEEGLWIRDDLAEWNARHPVGTSVEYWTGVREGPGTVGVTTSEAQLLGGDTLVVWCSGHTACIALSHVQHLGKVGS